MGAWKDPELGAALCSAFADLVRRMASSLTSYTLILVPLLATCSGQAMGHIFCALNPISALAKPGGSCDDSLLVIHKCILYFQRGS